MTGWPDSWKCAVACLLGEESQQLTSPHVRQSRKCSQWPPIFMHSPQPEGVCGSTSSICSTCVHSAMVGPLLPVSVGSAVFVVLVPYEAVMPPSTGRTAPVRPDQAGLHSPETGAAGCPGASSRWRRWGVANASVDGRSYTAADASSMGPRVDPGHTTLA